MKKMMRRLASRAIALMFDTKRLKLLSHIEVVAVWHLMVAKPCSVQPGLMCDVRN